ncbi:MAG: hypothetical protein ACI8VC_000203 [Candidatus Endobugula sp.]|jgi:hypothetical protein
MKYFFLIAALIISSTTAQAEVSIIAIAIPGLHQNDGNGEYDQIIRKSVVDKGLASIGVLPPSRAEQKFESCTNCCLSPANTNKDFYDFGTDVLVSKPMSTAKIYIFTAKETAPLDSLDDLKGKKVGVRNGMPYGKTFDTAGLNTKSVSTIELNINKLDSGRIDAMVSYVPDAYAAFESLGIPPFPHNKDKPIAVHPDSLVCKDVPQSFIDTFNSSL